MKTNRMNALIRSGAIAAAALLSTISPATAQFAGKPSLANVSGTGALANLDSWTVAVSADGNLIAFASDADNLVSFDTNGDSDVFLRDTVTGIVKRVSVTWQGEEGQGDSTCPSMSADGRYVAFSSRAWNMWHGAEHMSSATAVWEVYVHDRRGPQTIRLTTPIGGGPGTKDSGCPVISADGSRVAFASEASDLVDGDTNGVEDVFVYDIASGERTRASVADDGSQADFPSNSPAISGDGTLVAFTSFASNLTVESPLIAPLAPEQVYARDLTAETTELVSRAFGSPSALPSGGSCCPQISADGSEILFHSSASNLTSNNISPRPVRLFVRDRADEATEAIETLSIGYGPCGPHQEPLACDPSHTDGAVMSADGRFVAFLSGSFSLLPENNLESHRDLLYVQDRLTRRLRRVSVDPSGFPINSYPCGGSASTMALSADGRVLALAGGNAEAFGLPGANATAPRHIVRLDLPCDSEGRCRDVSVCPGTPATTCEPAERSRLRIRRNPPLAPRHDRLEWRWSGKGEDDGKPFIDPTRSGDYQLCVYAGETMNAQVDAGLPAGDPWRRSGKGWKRRDRDNAVELVTLRSTDDRAVIKVVSTSEAIDLPYLPLDTPQGVKVQLHEASTNRCWEAAFATSSIKVNRRGAVSPQGVTTGAVHANF